MATVFSKIKHVTSFIILNVVIIAVLLLLLEGLSSTIFVIHNIVKKPKLAERLHTTYDKELGWINLPNINIKDMYGPGVYLKTNSQSFRANSDFSNSVPDGKMRAICSGDSFTFGYGVNNDNTWCQLLISLNERLETINMGQGGYGVDQSYLWYKRESKSFDHDIHIFAFVHHDFDRMRYSQFLGYGKPVLSLQDNSLLVSNVPVPKRSYYVPWLTDNLGVLDQINLVKLVRKLFRQNEVDNSDGYVIRDENKMKQIIPAIFSDLYQINKSNQSICIIVYLPTREDHSSKSTKSWRQFINNEARKNELFFIDLIDEFQKLPAGEVEKLFILPGAIDYIGAANHYTRDGNKYIARVLNKKMLAIPEISDRLRGE